MELGFGRFLVCRQLVASAIDGYKPVLRDFPYQILLGRDPAKESYYVYYQDVINTLIAGGKPHRSRRWGVKRS